MLKINTQQALAETQQYFLYQRQLTFIFIEHLQAPNVASFLAANHKLELLNNMSS